MLREGALGPFEKEMNSGCALLSMGTCRVVTVAGSVFIASWAQDSSAGSALLSRRLVAERHTTAAEDVHAAV